MDDSESNDVTADAEYHRQLRRAAQRERHANENSFDSESRRRKDSIYRRTARVMLSEDQRNAIRHTNSATRARRRTLTDDATGAEIRLINMESHRANRSVRSAPGATGTWWDRVAILNASGVAQPLRLHWNRTCKMWDQGFDWRENSRQMFRLKNALAAIWSRPIPRKLLRWVFHVLMGTLLLLPRDLWVLSDYSQSCLNPYASVDPQKYGLSQRMGFKSRGKALGKNRTLMQVESEPQKPM
ncbi:hypothetical protein B0H11DRAFT_2187105 [Mycena galericulata]|nr:hypothetical protein B0H11DRAFT_2187105 [Mycena galericulata]